MVFDVVSLQRKGPARTHPPARPHVRPHARTPARPDVAEGGGASAWRVDDRSVLCVAILKEEQVLLIRHRYGQGYSLPEIREELNLSVGLPCLWNVVSGRTWKHV